MSPDLPFVPDLTRSLRITWPLAARFVRRYPVRNALVALSVALVITVFMVTSAYYQHQVTNLASRTQLLTLPADAVVMMADPIPPDESLPLLPARKVEAVWHLTAGTQWGLIPITGASQEFMSGLDPVQGSIPAGKAEVLISAAVARRASLGPGSTLRARVGQGVIDLRVSGILESFQYIMDGIVMPQEQLSSLVDGGRSPGNAYLVWALPHRSLDEAAVKRALSGVEMVITPRLPVQAVRQLVRQAYSPGRLLLGAVCLLGGLGVLNIMLLSFLQRRRYLGLLKAQGMRGKETGMLLWIEGAFMAVLGAVAGIGASAGGVVLVNRLTALHLTFPWRSLPWALVISALIFYAGAAIPARMSRDATIFDLLYRRNPVG